MSFRYALIPGRHQALTTFQASYLSDLRSREGDLELVWAVTSGNHGGTQRNPISGERRLGMIEAFVRDTDLPSHVYLITNMRPKDNFAHFVIEDIRTQSRGVVELTPENCIVVCSTPSVIAMYQALGFTIAPAELDESSGEFHAIRPWDVVEAIIAAGEQWRDDPIVQNELHPACLSYYERYGLSDLVREIFDDPLVGSEDGDITDTRDYATYRQAFEDGAERKVADFVDFIKPGRILDVGCATGQTLKVLSQRPELFESDLYGIEVARPLYQICEQRKQAGEFGDANVYFYQRNIMQQKLFKLSSLDTIITMALTHEVESYLGRSELEKFVRHMYDMLEPGGVYINYDVVGPNGKDDEVYVRFTEDDGKNPADISNELTGHELSVWLSGLSTLARFRRFAQDFRAVEGDTMTYRTETIDGDEYLVMRRADLCDFLAKKDYVDSWPSEMHERFCFFEHSDWVALLEAVGFELDSASRAVQNPWLIENRFAPAAVVYTKQSDGSLRAAPQPVTNTLLVAQKPEDTPR